MKSCLDCKFYEFCKHVQAGGCSAFKPVITKYIKGTKSCTSSKISLWYDTKKELYLIRVNGRNSVYCQNLETAEQQYKWHCNFK